MGSPRYMAPEQMEAAAKADSRSDIWSVGAVLYELLTGDAPYDAATYWEIYARAKKGPPPAPSAIVPSVSPEVDAIVLRCLRPDPAERYADVAELAMALAPYADHDGFERADAIARVLSMTRSRGTGGSMPPVVAPSRRRRVGPDLEGPPMKNRGLAMTLAMLAIGAAMATMAARSILAPPRRANASTGGPQSAPPPSHDPRNDIPPPEPPLAQPSAMPTESARPLEKPRKPPPRLRPPAPPPPAPSAQERNVEERTEAPDESEPFEERK
jgi:serine/threonine-protein kinase